MEMLVKVFYVTDESFQVPLNMFDIPMNVDELILHMRD